MSNYQQYWMEAKRLINDNHFYGYSGSSSFAHKLRLIREGIENHLLETEPESSLKISGKIIRSDGKLIEKVDDSDGSVGYELNSFCILWLEAAALCPVPDKGWIPQIIEIADGDEYGCRNEFLPNVEILLSAVNMQSLYDFYKERYTGNTDGDSPYHILGSAVNMGQVAKAMGSPELYEESVRIHSKKLNNMQLLDILSFYLEQNRLDHVLQTIETTVWEDRFQPEMLALKEKVFQKKGDPGALKDIHKQQFIHFRSADKLKIYLKNLDDESRNTAINEALEYAKNDQDLVRGLEILLDYHHYDKALMLILQRKDEFDNTFYSSLLGLLKPLKGKQQFSLEILIYRALLSDILNRAYSKAYRYAADYYRNLVRLDKKIEVYPDKMENHESFMEEIRAKHFRKRSFWKRV
jgi:Family of unknown function (DUF6880)